jgi:ergothioneine biosynthesis protein EgtB
METLHSVPPRAPLPQEPLGGELSTCAFGRYEAVRRATEALCAPLAAEDTVVQSMPEASPTKWHLAHTSWFFETFLLAPELEGYRAFDSRFGYLFNSYYESLGERLARPSRGLLTRPTLQEVFDYRRHVDHHMEALIAGRDDAALSDLLPLCELGLHHEQQHQELILTDLKHAFFLNPLRPCYRSAAPTAALETAPLTFLGFSEGVRWIGYKGMGFSFDNERPRHRAFVGAFELASRPVTCGEYLAFMDDGGYHRPALWLSDGWDAVQRQGLRAPLYWEERGGAWELFTLSGMRPVERAEPVCHVGYYEADAFARWAGARLPTEAEWEVAASHLEGVEGNFVEEALLHPAPADASPPGPLAQMFGDVWEWTKSPYVTYPGFEPAPGAVGEYNGKFSCNQLVLRGGSCASPRSHLRATYRNFFQPGSRWQFSGLRLARDSR